MSLSKGITGVPFCKPGGKRFVCVVTPLFFRSMSNLSEYRDEIKLRIVLQDDLQVLYGS
jgi:hypothetical protein